MSTALADQGSTAKTPVNEAAADVVPILDGFLQTEPARPHPRRRRAILAVHPEVEALVGYDRRTAVIVIAVVLGQTALAAAFGHLGLSYWWLALIAAYAIGAFANHAMFVAIHDAVHNAICKTPLANKWIAIIADLPNTVPTAMGFRCYHLKHHSHLGDYDYDADLPSHWEARLVGNRWYAKALWLFSFAIVQVTRLGRLKGTVPMTGTWTWINAGVIILYDLAILYFFGVNALFYLFASFWFSVGLHPVGARWIQEHFTFDPSQETYDYYGILNKVALNIGYHNEHHDFPEIPWTRLPALKKMAPEFYDDLKTHKSWTKLFFSFIFDPRYTLYSRVDRSAANLAQKA
ncbi:MAG: fatty acid desaturase [Methylovirgula sp.]